MFPIRKHSDAAAKLAALDRVQAVIEFDLSGNVLTANENFLSVVGYTLPEIAGRHHGLFVDPKERDSDAYRAFWQRLREGRFEAAQFRRIAKDGRDVWIQASYNPIAGRDGRPCKIVKFATDITRQKAEDADRAGQIAAIRKAQAVIEFGTDGIILDANDNFLSTLGYTLPEIRGRHHSLFVEPAYAAGAEYAAFWAALKGGAYQAAQYRRLGKGGREVWIQASYNPILDAAGRPYKIVKFATDITEQVQLLANLRRMIDENFGEIDRAVDHSSQASRTASDAAGTTAGNVQAMAAASEELAASVAEVAQSMARSRAASDDATAEVRTADGYANRLSDAARSMSGIVGLIQSIAAQINLLALNATIEAARSGEAGRGFAVVAQEVKHLAAQASQATEQINGEINGMQAISANVVGALASIRACVDTMREQVVTTAAALEEQSAVTHDLSVNMQQASGAVSDIATSISAISSAVTQVSGAVATTRDAAQVLAR
ncbi:methyl-accepting chemotaxis protein [Methylobacterium sp. sgz302541]|uniref:methyl-accepting chemotaxis protein n=1 Tax=unclassified Methylobacterium TaxID=2615210 RepID=UPI003D339EFA